MRTIGEGGERVVSRDGKAVGITTGSARMCSLEGCSGLRLGVRWPREGGKAQTTYPCMKGMDFKGGKWRIL